MRKFLAAIVLILMTGTAQAQSNFGVEARHFPTKDASEFICEYKNFSADWIHAGDNFFKVGASREIFSLMGTGLEWNVALNAVDKNFAVLPSVGVNLYMRIRPRLDVYVKFSGMTIDNRGHFTDFESGLKYFPQKNFSISAGWRRVDFKLRRGGEVSDFDLNGMFAGVRYDF